MGESGDQGSVGRPEGGVGGWRGLVGPAESRGIWEPLGAA